MLCCAEQTCHRLNYSSDARRDKVKREKQNTAKRKKNATFCGICDEKIAQIQAPETQHVNFIPKRYKK